MTVWLTFQKSSKGRVFLHKANCQEEEFLCHFTKRAEFGTFPKIRERVTTLPLPLPPPHGDPCGGPSRRRWHFSEPWGGPSPGLLGSHLNPRA